MTNRGKTDESHITSRLETHKEQHGGKRERYSRGLMLNYKTFILLEVFIVAFLVVFFKTMFLGAQKNLIDGLPTDGKEN